MKKVLVTGAAGGMGYETLKQMVEDGCDYKIVALDLPNDNTKAKLFPFKDNSRVTVMMGDLTDYSVVKNAIKDCDLIIHIAAFVSPAADYFPKKAMEVNYGSTKNFINAIYELGQQETTKFVSIGTVAETGDRMPPIHWGRVGDPIKPSMYDYYAVSKVAAERLVVESGLKYWVSLRQTGIMGPAMSKVRDSMQYFYDAYLKEVGAAKPFAQVINKLPGGQKFMGWIIRQTFKKYQLGEHGTRRWSYNLLNGIHTAEHRGLIEDILRCEYGFKGIVMTDWILEMMADKNSINRIALSNEVAKAGGDLFMPGCKGDFNRMKAALEDGSLSRKQLQINATRVLRMIDTLVG